MLLRSCLYFVSCLSFVELVFYLRSFALFVELLLLSGELLCLLCSCCFICGAARMLVELILFLSCYRNQVAAVFAAELTLFPWSCFCFAGALFRSSSFTEQKQLHGNKKAAPQIRTQLHKKATALQAGGQLRK